LKNSWSGFPVSALETNYSFGLLALGFFCRYKACSHNFATDVTDELHFCDSIVALNDFERQ